MYLVIEVRSAPVVCGTAPVEEPDAKPAQWHYSYAIIHPLVGNNDPLVAQMYEALAELPAGGVECNVTARRRHDETPVIEVQIGEWENLAASVSDVREVYDQVVSVAGTHRQTVGAAV